MYAVLYCQCRVMCCFQPLARHRSELDVGEQDMESPRPRFEESTLKSHFNLGPEFGTVALTDMAICSISRQMQLQHASAVITTSDPRFQCHWCCGISTPGDGEGDMDVSPDDTGGGHNGPTIVKHLEMLHQSHSVGILRKPALEVEDSLFTHLYTVYR